MGKKNLIFFLMICLSCATLKSEKDHYKFIVDSFNAEKFNLASYHIIAFEGKFPMSPMICDTWKIQMQIYEIKKKSDDYIKKLREKYAHRCQ